MTRPSWVNRLVEVFYGSRLSRNTGQKIISLLFAVLFWLYVMDQVNPEMVKELENIKVEFLNLPSVSESGLVIMNEQDHFVNVKVKGRRNDLFDVSQDDVRVTADLSGYGKGTANIPLETRTFSGSFRIQDLSQKSVEITFDRIVEVSKPVNIDLVGEAQNGYIRDELDFEPKEIIVKGPESFVNTIAMVSGDLNLQGATSDMVVEVPMLAQDSEGNTIGGVTLTRSTVRATLGISKLKTLSLNERITGLPAEGYEIVRVQISPTAVTIRGSEEDVDGIDRLYTMPIDITGIMSTADVEVQLDLPEGLQAPYLNVPAIATVYVEPYVTKVFEIPATEIPVENLPDELVVNNAEFSGIVVIKIRDIESVMEDITLDELHVYIDGSALKPGVANTAEVIVELPVTARDMDIDGSSVRIPVRLKELMNNTPDDGSSEGDSANASPAALLGDRVLEP